MTDLALLCMTTFLLYIKSNFQPARMAEIIRSGGFLIFNFQSIYKRKKSRLRNGADLPNHQNDLK